MTPDEELVFNAVYQDRIEFLQANPRSLDDLESWKDSILKQEPVTEQHAISLRATAQAYEDEIKRLKLLQLISK
ncbi:hypothetical protein [Marinobacter shengliensis]|uniref:hypothetical protein n=1 Tax=Marinobacter shengliensis TaxID=1389223 RepID=UPI001E2D9B0F|nr:hypothetical protein [Marinobacter shengliensis]MCD1628484.1 hypothetical protein [Marinobacter shengliensis]